MSDTENEVKKQTVNVVNKATGEVMEFPADNMNEVAASYHQISQTIKALERAKDKLKERTLNAMGSDDQLELNGYTFKRNTVQLKTYDTSVLRANLDEDLFATVMVPNKSMIDSLIAEGVKQPTAAAIPPEIGSVLRDNMIVSGTQTRLTLERE